MLNPKDNCARFSNAVSVHSKYYFVQPVMPPFYSCVQKTSCTFHKSNQIFLTNQGFEQCTCGNYQSYLPDDSTMSLSAPPENSKLNQKTDTSSSSEDEVIFDLNKSTPIGKCIPVRSVSCEDADPGDNFKSDGRRVSLLVDELLLKIYNGERKFSSAGATTESYFNGNSSDSSNHFGYKLNALCRRKYSFSGISEDSCQKWLDVMRAKLMNKTLTEIVALKETLECNVAFVGSLLVRQLKRRDILLNRRDAEYGLITAFLQAVSAKRSEDTKIQFSMKPNAGESGFQQWHGAMKMVARLPGGIPREFRKTLWLTLAERHISSKNINWSHVERTCFNDSTNPDDEELGVQIVKDLHRTGCSLFCGTSGEENQAVLKRVLLAYARWNKSVGYCQGFNMLAALILEVMDRCEYNALKVMIYLIEGVLPESYFANSLRGFSIDMAVFRDLLRLKLPELSRHLEALQTGSNDAGNTYEPPLTNAFTMQWFLTLFCNCLPHSTVLRVWDLIFLEGNQVLLKTALAIWDTLSDRIMPVKSADEFYSIMCVLTREMLEFGLMDANSLIKTISSIELSELTELRERYIYNITPWTQVARNGLRLFYSDDEMDDSDVEAADEKASDGAYGFLKVATKYGSQSIRSISPSSILGPLANEKEKIALDILALKKQYCKIKERQRQAQIIFTAANNTQEIVGSMMSSTPGPAINHLFLSKNAVSSPKVIKTQKPPSIPVSRAVQRLKENAVPTDEPHSDRGETVYWDKRMKKRKRRRTRINVSKTASLDSLPPEPDSSDSSDSSPTSSFKSSSSTELCDELAEIDSEDANTSISEYGSSPHYRLRSSNLSLLDDDKSESELQSKPDLPAECEPKSSEPATFSSLHNPNEEHLLNGLLTTSIMAHELKETAWESAEGNDPPNLQESQVPSDNCDNNPKPLRSSQSDWSCSSSKPAEDLETALEHMKIDALEILLSSQTLESIRRDSQAGIYPTTDCDKPSDSVAPFSINRETEIALQRILTENTEVLKKVNQTYSSFESRCDSIDSSQDVFPHFSSERPQVSDMLSISDAANSADPQRSPESSVGGFGGSSHDLHGADWLPECGGISQDTSFPQFSAVGCSQISVGSNALESSQDTCSSFSFSASDCVKRPPEISTEDTIPGGSSQDAGFSHFSESLERLDVLRDCSSDNTTSFIDDCSQRLLSSVVGGSSPEVPFLQFGCSERSLGCSSVNDGSSQGSISYFSATDCLDKPPDSSNVGCGSSQGSSSYFSAPDCLGKPPDSSTVDCGSSSYPQFSATDCLDKPLDGINVDCGSCQGSTSYFSATDCLDKLPDSSTVDCGSSSYPQFSAIDCLDKPPGSSTVNCGSSQGSTSYFSATDCSDKPPDSSTVDCASFSYPQFSAPNYLGKPPDSTVNCGSSQGSTNYFSATKCLDKPPDDSTVDCGSSQDTDNLFDCSRLGTDSCISSGSSHFTTNFLDFSVNDSSDRPADVLERVEKSVEPCGVSDQNMAPDLTEVYYVQTNSNPDSVSSFGTDKVDSRIKCQTDDENEEPKDSRKRKKYKSLDNLHVAPKSKLKIGVVSRAGKWISISIDNSDLVLNHLPVDNLIESVKLNNETIRQSEDRKTEWESKKCSEGPKDPYLHLNFDIIAAGKKRRDPMEQYVHKKNMISQNYRAPELTAINFNPFPSKPNSRPPKELGVKLGLYTSSKK